MNLWNLLSPEQQLEKLTQRPLHLLREDERVSQDIYDLWRWWQDIATGEDMGRMFEYSLGWQLEQEGWQVDYHGRRLGKGDLGRDLIATRNPQTTIIQCKFQASAVPAKDIFYLYGSSIAYKREFSLGWVEIAFYSLSEFLPEAQEAARLLNVHLHRVSAPIAPFPAVKCKVGKDGCHRYHLPWQPNYDRLVIDPKSGDCRVWGVDIAAKMGFSGTEQVRPNWSSEA